ncbi:Arabinogalactan peptide 20 [Abeliophyllum distichum]|uniref:Arabinogalactan peptide 20 n=1 Tax=Abeliophyllum distichum TaxID=126358 RepID=A0ABD1UQV5_9LAMI
MRTRRRLYFYRPESSQREEQRRFPIISKHKGSTGKKMEVITRASVGVVMVLAFIMAAAFPTYGMADSTARLLSPAPSPTSDGMAIDQGIAYFLMLVALVLTYIIH